MKKVTLYESEPVTSYYIWDAEGNLMATYEVKTVDQVGDWFFLKDQYLYGSRRLNPTVPLLGNAIPK